VVAQVEIVSKVRKRFIIFKIRLLKPSAVNPGVNLGSAWGQPGVSLGSTWGQPGVNLSSNWGQAAPPYRWRRRGRRRGRGRRKFGYQRRRHPRQRRVRRRRRPIGPVNPGLSRRVCGMLSLNDGRRPRDDLNAVVTACKSATQSCAAAG
jgi:hypothetical protein